MGTQRILSRVPLPSFFCPQFPPFPDPYCPVFSLRRLRLKTFEEVMAESSARKRQRESNGETSEREEGEREVRSRRREKNVQRGLRGSHETTRPPCSDSVVGLTVRSSSISDRSRDRRGRLKFHRAPSLPQPKVEKKKK